MTSRLSAALALIAGTFVPAQAVEPLHVRIDAFIVAGHPDYAKQASPIASDAEFLRRITLDLTGTIPTAADTRAFLADPDSNKREKLIDKLLASPGYARRMAFHYDVVLMERRRDAKVPRAAWETYLREVFTENRPYDAFARELLSADGIDPKLRPAAKFYLDRDFEPNLVTRDIGRVFLGKNMQCAQCHDHPLVADYKQADYFGILAFLNRSFLFPNAKAATAVIAEKADGEVTFVSVFDKAKKTSSALPRVLEAKVFVEPKFEKGKEYKVAPAANVKPVPSYSRREKLAAAITDNPAFARTGANRLWAMLLGRGLVNPVDLDHSANPPSHPELLNLLAKEFATHNFDVKWLLREIALSETYQRSSEASANATDMPPDRYLAATLKPLSAEQLGYAVFQATGTTDAERLALGKSPTEATLDAKLAPRLAPFRNIFGGQPGIPDTGVSTTLDQSLFLKFGPAMRGLIAPRAGNLSDRLSKLTNDHELADELFLGVLSRFPTDDEKKDAIDFVKASTDRRIAINELVWALLATAEFRFNH